MLLLSLISCSIKGQEVLIKTHKKYFVICTVITQSSLLDHTRCKSLKIQQHYFDSMIDSLGLQHRWRSDSPAAQNTTDLQNLEALNSWWGKRISKNHSKRSSQHTELAVYFFLVRGLYKMRSATYFPAIFLCFFWYRKQEIANRISPIIWNFQFLSSTFIERGKKNYDKLKNKPKSYTVSFKSRKKSKIGHTWRHSNSWLVSYDEHGE